MQAAETNMVMNCMLENKINLLVISYVLTNGHLWMYVET